VQVRVIAKFTEISFSKLFLLYGKDKKSAAGLADF
jgi:hypothetical protein